jgi:hypothetical protein
VRARTETSKETGRIRRVDHCGRCETSGNAALWGKLQNEAINELLMKVVPLILPAETYNRARAKRGRRTPGERHGAKAGALRVARQVLDDKPPHLGTTTESFPEEEIIDSSPSPEVHPWTAHEREMCLRLTTTGLSLGTSAVLVPNGHK